MVYGVWCSCAEPAGYVGVGAGPPRQIAGAFFASALSALAPPVAEGFELASDAPGVEVARSPDVGVLPCAAERVEPGALLWPQPAALGFQLAVQHRPRPQPNDHQIGEAGLATSRVVGVVAQQAKFAASLPDGGE